MLLFSTQNEQTWGISSHVTTQDNGLSRIPCHLQHGVFVSSSRAIKLLAGESSFDD